jgi:hypothetical protein
MEGSMDAESFEKVFKEAIIEIANLEERGAKAKLAKKAFKVDDSQRKLRRLLRKFDKGKKQRLWLSDAINLVNAIGKDFPQFCWMVSVRVSQQQEILKSTDAVLPPGGCFNEKD